LYRTSLTTSSKPSAATTEQMLWSELPVWDEIPIVPGMPKGCAWGLYDKDGKRDQLGTLNLITSETILEAKNEIQHGESVALK
jgi:hypothetical protein